MAILELVVTQEYYGQLVVNRYHYIGSGTPAAVSMSFGLIAATKYLAASIAGGVFPTPSVARQIQDIQVNTLHYISAYARDLYSVSDFYETPYPSGVNGTQTGAPASPTLAYAVTSNRVRTDVRRGQKRFAGVKEEFMDAGGVLSADALINLGYIANEMSATLTYDDEGNTLTYTPCILGFDEYETPSGKTAYRKFATASEQLEHAAIGIDWQPVGTVRTQVSRQYGRGR
jgi:hypothetical protein